MKKFVLIGGITFLLGVAVVSAVFYFEIVKDLPDVETLREVRLQTPLRVYSADNLLIAEFGEKRRRPVAFNEVPALFTAAFISAEDASFFSHSGVDWLAVARAAIEYLKTGEKRQGGSTITMQLARNFFLSRKKTFVRKFKELVLAIVIERKLSKNDILQLYLNKIFLGHRAYGIGAAAQVYYGSAVGELNLAQMALRWILDYDAVTVVIPGSKTPGQVPENASASQLAPLPEALHEQLNRFYHERVARHIRGKY